ncbi:hypothetical protein QUF56_09235 [Ureibacillus composti]|nr:hypothetical protein [Ureibacillus composti]
MDLLKEWEIGVGYAEKVVELARQECWEPFDLRRIAIMLLRFSNGSVTIESVVDNIQHHLEAIHHDEATKTELRRSLAMLKEED